jgi:hypothetical protein
VIAAAFFLGPHFVRHIGCKDWPAKKVRIFNTIVHLVKTSGNILVFLPAFYLIGMWLMKSPKNFEKITPLKI